MALYIQHSGESYSAPVGSSSRHGGAGRFLDKVDESKATTNLTESFTNPSRYSGSGGSDTNIKTDPADEWTLADYLDILKSDIYDLNEQNNARMLESAERQMQFQQQSQAKAMQFNAEQAKINRDWQQYMSDTAHQREVQDLIAAGLNPVLSANGGAPIGTGASASTQAMSGSQAQVDTSITNFLGNLAGAMASMHNAEVSAKAAIGAASINASASKAIAQWQLQQPGSFWGSVNHYLNNFSDAVSGGDAPTFGDLVRYAVKFGMDALRR